MKAFFALLVLFVAIALAGCATPPVQLDNAARLIARPDFEAARQAAPEWCRDALKTINQLEYTQERK
ncbi:MAG: hypothetical protein HZA93_23790 [Verrucomicrobia bacterium]|nr:hypothetical protein [Verrucomicrobiota bacterium]